jgi:SPP1 gp7 family putative phage head morphogenesis protein
VREVALKPIYHYQKYSEHIEKVLVFELYYAIFRPLFEILGIETKSQVEVREGKRWNAPGSAVRRALESGKISYSEPYFYGQFNALISRELRALGAQFDSRKKAYKLGLGDIPLDLKLFITSSRLKIKAQADNLLKKLDEIAEKPLALSVGSYTQNIMDDLGKQFERTVKPSLEVPMQLSEGISRKLQADYSTNMNLYINDWKDWQIVRLRDQIQASVTEGFRADKMVSRIESEYGVTQNKAKFLARQETALLVSKYRESRYQEAGLNQYIWSTSHDERVRPDHKELNGKKFSWDSPPITNRTTGARNNPGEDFGCRCISIPILRIP